jgi:hypothetical protein
MQVRAKTLGANAILVLLSLALSLLLLEILVRLLFPIYDPSGHVTFRRLPDGTQIGPRGVVLRQVKNTGDYDVEIRFNDLGFRDEKVLATATEEDLFVVGDSFAFGWGVSAEDRFSDRLQATLNRPVFNIAAGGTDFDGYYRLIHYAEKNKVTIKNLVISVTMENDLHVYDTSLPRVPASSLHSTVLVPLNLNSVKRRLSEHSALYVCLTHAVHQTKWLKRIAVQFGLIIPNHEAIGDENVSAEALTTSVLRLLQLVAGRNAIVLIIPSRRLWVGDADRRAQAASVHARFVDISRASGLQVLDLRDRFERTGNPLSYHFTNDGHWNKGGHWLASKALLNAIRNRE